MTDNAALHRLALRLAILADDVAKAETAYGAVRKEAEPVFAEARRHGHRQQAVRLPDGTEAGLISIQAGATVVDVDEGALLLHVSLTDPGEIQDYVLPSALADKRVLDLLSEFLPDLVGRRVNPEARKRLQTELEEHDGCVIDRAGGGELVQVATITNLEPTGKFSYRAGKQAAIQIAAAIEAGTLTRDGEILPAAGAEPQAGDPGA